MNQEKLAELKKKFEEHNAKEKPAPDSEKEQRSFEQIKESLRLEQLNAAMPANFLRH